MDSPRFADQAAFTQAREHPVAHDGSQTVVARRSSYPRAHHIPPHWHARAQFLYAISGTMTVRTPRRAWIVPPTRALWVPAHTAHEIHAYEPIEMRSLYVHARASGAMPSSCVVLEVTPLMRELVLRAMSVASPYDESGDEGLLMRLLLAEMRALPRCALDLPLPDSADLSALCEDILEDLSTRRCATREADRLGISTRTLYRRFLRETGITFARWKHQARLLESIRRLAGGGAVTEVALDLGYESASAFSNMFRRSLGMSPRAFTRTSSAADDR